MDERPRLLVVDDEEDLAADLAGYFERGGFIVATAHSGVEGLAKVESFAPHVILLDVLMPGMDGRELLRRLRQRDKQTAVVILSKVGDAAERGQAILEGADDYINKPYENIEVWARVQSALRRVLASRPSMGTAARLSSGDLVIDRRASIAYLRGKRLDVHHRALEVLDYLMCHPNELLARERFLSAIWGYSDVFSLRTLDNHISELRRALKDDPRAPRYIETVSGQGYRFISPVEMHG